MRKFLSFFKIFFCLILVFFLKKESTYAYDISGYVHDEKFLGQTLYTGIDVSTYQRTIDWEKVKNDGVEFAIIRVGYRGYSAGNVHYDTRAVQNMEGANAAGVPIGVYFFSQAITEEEAREEADFLINAVAGYKIDLPLILDYEYAGDIGRMEAATLSKEEETAIVNAFADRVREAGYTPMVYANKYMLNATLNKNDLNCAVWLAHYTYDTTYTGEYEFWQCASDGHVDGITGNVDLDFWYVSDLSTASGTPSYGGRIVTNVKNGWVIRNDKKYYYENDEQIKGYMALDGIYYHFNEETGELDGSWEIETAPPEGVNITSRATGSISITGANEEEPVFGWSLQDGKYYWYEDGIRQGVKYLENGELDISFRGKEIYDPSTDAWYWLDCVQEGAMAINKDLYMESLAGAWSEDKVYLEDGSLDYGASTGKWVMYDLGGRMIKGWAENNGKYYYLDPIYGTMAKGYVFIEGKVYHFNEITSILNE